MNPMYRHSVGAGGSGGGSQTLYLIDIVTGKSYFVSVADMREPIWLRNSKHFGYIKKTYRYVGSHVSSIGVNVVQSAIIVNPTTFEFKVGILESRKLIVQSYQKYLCQQRSLSC